MLTFNLDPTQYAVDIATALDYSNGAWGLYEYFGNSPNGGGYFNMGLDANGEYYWKKGFASNCGRARIFGGLVERIRFRSSICCPCICTANSCDPPVDCPDCGGHDIVPTTPTPPGTQFSTGTIVPVSPVIPLGGILLFGFTKYGDGPTNNPVVTSGGTGVNNGGAEGDPHFEGFDNIFDFHGTPGKYYQLYKSDNLLINAKMIPAYHCQDNGTFMEEIYIKGTKNGTPFEILWSYLGRADVLGLLKKIKKTYKSLLPAYRTEKSNIRKYLVGGVDGLELKNKPDWEDDEVAELNTDAGKITLSRSQFLSQYCVNFLFTPKEMKSASGVLGQTMNMKFRLPNELFEIDYINSSTLKNIILPEMHFPVKYYPMRTGKPPCTTCNDKLNPKDTYKDDKGQKWTIA